MSEASGSLDDMTLLPTSLDHVALWLADRDAVADLACDHLGMHVIERTDKFTLVGSDARRGKLTLFAAEGPREPGALEAIVLRVNDLSAALERLPDDLDVTMRPEGVAEFAGPERLTIGLAERETEVDYDLDHVVLRVADVEASAEAFAALGFERDGTKLSVAGKWLRLVEGGAEEGERPLLNHLAVLVDSAEEAERSARSEGVEVADVVDAPNTLAVFVWTPGRVKLEFVEHKPSFSLV
jgi:catechol 2,3-dioxygenase-like lactoylglutathione lyase family enzyme